MQRARSYRIVSVVLCLGLAGFITLAACSDYQEGERCEVLNGNGDCASGLQCLPKAVINTPYNSSDRCCPVDRSTATHPACIVQSATDAGNATPSDANNGPATDVTVGDAPVETSTIPEAGTDADAADAAEGG